MPSKPKSKALDAVSSVVIEALPGPEEFGPAMSALDDRQRAFVLALLEMGNENHGKAAKLAGYGNEASTPNYLYMQGHRVANNPKVREAMAEEARRRLDGNAWVAIGVVAEIMTNEKAANKDRLKAAEIVLNRTGFHAKTETLVKVEDVTTEAQIQRVLNMTKVLGLDPKPMLESIGIEYTPFEES